MITLYKPNETDFTHNGIGILDANIYEPVVEETLNGLFIFSFCYPLFAPHGAEIEGQCIVKVPTPDGEQLFRVARPQPSMGELKVFCYHIFYDLTDNLIEDTFIENKSGTAALDQLSTKCQYPHPFKFFSDISKVSSSRLVRKNPVEAILDTGQDNCFLNRWGGELKRDNFNVHMLVNRGKDRGVVIEHKKNLLGYEGDIDWQSPVTRIMPIGFNGLMLPEKYVDSPNINKYPRPKIRVVEFKDVKAQDDKNNDPNAVPLDKAYEMLRQFSKEMYSKQKVDQPKATYKVGFQELSQTEEYKDFAVLQRVYMGDTVTVKHVEDNIDLQAKVISYKYDPITEEYIGLILGNYKESFTDIAGKVDQIVNDVSNMESSFLNQAKEMATGLINSGFGGHVRVYPDRILIMDTKDEMKAKKVWQWNINGLGYSDKGINGPYGLAMTMDGSIVADFIKTGRLSAELVQAGFNDYGDNIQLMSDGLHAKQNGKTSMVLGGNGVLSIYDKNEKPIGYVGHTYKVDDPTKRGIVINGELGRFLSIGFRGDESDGQDPNAYYPYMEFADNAYYGRKGIFVSKPLQMNCNKIVLNANSSGDTNIIQELKFGDIWKNSIISTYGVSLAHMENGNIYQVAGTESGTFNMYGPARSRSGLALGSAEIAEHTGIYQDTSGSAVITSKNTIRLCKTSGDRDVRTVVEIMDFREVEMWANLNMHNFAINNIGQLNVTGSKNAIHITRDGVRATPAYETAESYLGDIGAAKTDENGRVVIKIDELFSDTVNTSIEYQVFVSSYCKSHVWVSEREENYFIVESSEPNAAFSWELKAKRRGFENERLVLQEEYTNDQIKKSFTDIKVDGPEGSEMN
ncbi:phage tail protein [Bacillus cytotoxicus]|uniref:Phage tail protein n=1 Tax=Bacillus cytotoxicus TaxID=580165 RepID=A0ACC6A560_9BACI|nr:phage tail protein [Bacillus cytotoxicus]